MFKKYFTLSAALVFGFTAFAQNVQNNDQLELPDVTTVIDTENLKVEQDALPDFKSVLEVSGDSGSVTVQLPDVDNQDTQVEVKTDKSKGEKLIFAEGQIGGGYPFLFAGNFSVFRQTGDSPFKIAFNHDSAAGYAGHALNDGYFDSTTAMDLQRKITRGNFEWNVEGSYNRVENGLQNQGGDVSSVNQNVIGGGTDFKWNLPKGHSIGFGATTQDYIRYANASSTANLADWVKQTQVFSVLPNAFYSWEGYGFKTGVNAEYAFDLYKGVSNRGEFTANFSWENPYIKVFTDAGVVVSNKMTMPVTVPFTVGINTSIPVRFSSRNVTIAAQGGMISERTSIADYEQKYKFAGFDSLADETTYWYGMFDFVLPVKASFTTNFNTTFKSYAFGNGLYQPVYSQDAVNGLYGFVKNDVQCLSTELGMSYFYKMFSVSVNVNGNFIDIPVMESIFGCSVNMALSSPKGNWGVEGNMEYLFHDTPDVSLSGFVKISSSAKVIAQIDDLLYLVNPSARRLYGYTSGKGIPYPGYSQYLERCGSATLSLKFNF